METLLVCHILMHNIKGYTYIYMTKTYKSCFHYFVQLYIENIIL